MKINRDNCEAWFLDYYEGNLSKEREEEMRAFLAMNSDLQEVFESYDDLSFDPEKNIKFEGKDALRKEVPVTTGISDSNYTAWIVALSEGELNDMEEKRVRDFMDSRPKVQHEFDLLQKSKLKPEQEIVFGKKNDLKKKIEFTAQNFMEYAVMAMDGALDTFTAESFFDFIAKNKSFESEYNALLATKVEADASIVFEKKNVLKRSSVVITAENFNEFAVAAMDGELDKFSAESFFDFIAKNKLFGKEYNALLATKLVADENIVFADKDSLKKKNRGVIIWWRYAAVAAMLLLAVFFYFNRGEVSLDPGKQQDIANNSPVKKQNIIVAPDHDTVVVPVPQNNVVPKDQYAANSNSNNTTNQQSNINNTSNQHNKDFAFVSFPSHNELPVLQTHVYTNVDFSDVMYTDMNGTPQVVAQNNSISVTQYAMRWMKNKLDRRNDDGELNRDMMAVNGKTNGDVSGFDLTKSAVDRLAYATNSNLDLDKSSEGTVLTVFGYDVIVARD